jgi:hypothetical protein
VQAKPRRLQKPRQRDQEHNADNNSDDLEELKPDAEKLGLPAERR